jgi:hypothetical protein
MELEIKRPQTVNAKTLKIHLKVTDQFSAQLKSDKNETIHNQEEGYVPDFMPGEHYGDYVILDIDIDSGLITNWKKVTAQQIQEWIENED